MKKLFEALLFISLSLLPTKVVSQNTTTITVPATPGSIKKFGSLESAKQFLQQKANCIIFSEKCSTTDTLSINYALGFAFGSMLPVTVIAKMLNSYGDVRNQLTLKAAQVVTEAIFLTLGFKGELLTPLYSGIQNIVMTALFLFADVAGLASQILEAPSKFAFLKIISTYLTMNIKCIWSSSYCQGLHSTIAAKLPTKIIANYETAIFGPETRRFTLYFWLGYVSGLAFSKIPFKKATSTAQEKLGEKLIGITTSP